MVVHCDIEFDNNPHGIYFAGQVLSGRITLTADKSKQVKGVVLKIKGFAHTDWSESHSTSTTDSNGKTTTSSKTTTYSGHEEYIGSVTYLLGSPSNNSNEIAPGIHTYTYSCHIPTNCPSSYEGFYGHIRYLIKVVLIRPWKFNQTYTKGFTVLKMLNLNYESPLLRMPAETDVQKTFCCGPCKSEPLKIQVNIPQSAYVPGQIIPISVLVANDSNVPVEGFTVSLVMIVCCYSQSPTTETRTERTVVTKLQGEGVLRHCNKLHTYELLVPATPPTCFNLCKIIQIAYQLELKAKIKGIHAIQVVCTPVTIGNVPLMGVIQQQPRANSDYGMLRGMPLTEVKESTADDGARTPTTPWDATDSNIPPPSYEQATHMQLGKINADEEHDFGECEFAPRYPVFNLPSPTAPPGDVAEQLTADDCFTQQAIDPDKSTWL